MEEVDCSHQLSTSMTIALTGKLWCGTDISERQRQHYCRCPQLCQPIGTRSTGQRWLWHNTSPLQHVRSLRYRLLTKESEDNNTKWPSTESTKAPDIPGVVRCKEKYSRELPPVLELQGWASSRRQIDLQSPQASDPSFPKVQIPQGLTHWPFRGRRRPYSEPENVYTGQA